MADVEERRYEELMETWDNSDIRELAVAFKDLQDRYNEAKSVSAHIYAEFELLRKNVIPKRMEDMGIDTVKVTGVGRLQVGQQVSAKQLDKQGLISWLNAHGHEAIVAETVNASTLGSFMKAQIANGDPIPDDDVVSFTVYEVASVVKA